MKSVASTCALVLAAIGQVAADDAIYRNPEAAVDDRVSDLLKRMSVKEKMAQVIQGDMSNYIDLVDGTLNQTGLEWNMEYRANSVWTGLYTNLTTITKAGKIAQDYLLNETELGKFLRAGVECRLLTPILRHPDLHPERGPPRHSGP